MLRFDWLISNHMIIGTFAISYSLIVTLVTLQILNLNGGVQYITHVDRLSHLRFIYPTISARNPSYWTWNCHITRSADAEIVRHVSRLMQPKCKTPHFPIPFWSSLVEFRIAGYYYPNRLWHAGSQNNDLFCHVPISTFCCTITV